MAVVPRLHKEPWFRRLGARASTTVKSHSSCLPSSQGIMVTPPERLPSVRYSSRGSSTEGKSRHPNVCFRKLRVPWREKRLALLVQERPCKPSVQLFYHRGTYARVGGNRSKERDRKTQLVLRSTYQIFEWDRNNSDRNFYNVVRYVHIPLVPWMQGRSEAMPQCCYLAKGAKRPSNTTNTIKFDRIPFDHCNSIKRFDLCPSDQKYSTYLQPPRMRNTDVGPKTRTIWNPKLLIIKCQV